MCKDLKTYLFLIVVTFILVTVATLGAGCSGTSTTPNGPYVNNTTTLLPVTVASAINKSSSLGESNLNVTGNNTISFDDAVDRVRVYFFDPNISVTTGRFPEPRDGYYSMICNGIGFYVNNTSGKVHTESFVTDKDDDLKLTMKDAISIALGYEKTFYNGFNVTVNMTLTRAMLLAGSEPEYLLEWNEIIDGLYTSNHSIIRISAVNGDVKEHFETYGPSVIPLNASISREQAIQIAEHTDYFRNYIPTTIDARRTIGWGTQREIWLVNIQCLFNRTTPEGYIIEDHRGGEVRIDAGTGEVLSVNPCL